jgi:replicative DNA helicase
MLEVEETARRIKTAQGLALVLIDYAQQIADIDPRMPRYLAVGDVAQRAVALARELAVPILICSQINVVKEARGVAYSFRESAILEHKAHNVLILAVSWAEDYRGFKVIESAEFQATKNRSGPLFTLPVKYEPELFRLSAVEQSE